MTLNEYIQAVRDILRDDFGNFYSNAQLTRWINRARKQVAKVGQCVRVLPPSLASVQSISVTSGGSGYVTTPVVTISDPDGNALDNVTATATATISSGAVTAIAVVVAGSGYVAEPTVTISGGGGTGATATAVLTAHMATAESQEKYTYASINAVIQDLDEYDGVGEVIGIQTIAVSQGAMKPVLDFKPWSWLQAYMRSYPYLRTWPVMWSQYGQGQLGSFYIYPIPVQVTQMDVDCYCSVLDLSDSQTVDMVPEPWCEAVYYYAANLAYLYSQRQDDARAMLAIYDAKMVEARVATTPSRVPTFYPGQQVN